MLCPIVRRKDRGRGDRRRAPARGAAARRRPARHRARDRGHRHAQPRGLFAAHEPRLPARAPGVRDEVRARAGRARGADRRPRDRDRAAAGREAILELYLACGFESRSEERMREVLGDGRHAHAVARAGGELAAFVELETHWPKRPWVAFAGVDKERRDRGLGSALVAWLLARQFAAGAKAAPARALARQPHRAARVREGRLPPFPADRCAGEEAVVVARADGRRRCPSRDLCRLELEHRDLAVAVDPHRGAADAEAAVHVEQRDSL